MMNMLASYSTWPTLRWPWILLALSALLLETTALYFQYKMGLEPCIMCVYQRVAVLGIIGAALPSIVFNNNLIARLISYVLWAVASVWGLKLALEHVRMQNPDNFMLLMSCDIYPDFPNWLQLHELIPSIFEPRGTCGDIDWSFLGFSMPQWMVVVFSIYLLILVSLIFCRFKTHKQL